MKTLISIGIGVAIALTLLRNSRLADFIIAITGGQYVLVLYLYIYWWSSTKASEIGNEHYKINKHKDNN